MAISLFKVIGLVRQTGDLRRSPTDSERVPTTPCPSSVDRWLALRDELDLEEVLQAVRDHLTEHPNEAVESAEEFRWYVDMWADALREAKERDWGMLILGG